MPAGLGGEAVLQHVQFPGDQRKQVAGLGEGVAPHREVPPTGEEALLQPVAVGQQVGKAPVGLDPDPEGAQHVGPVGIIGDLAESLGLALGAEAAAGHVEPLEGGIALRVDLDLRRQHEVIRHAAQGQVLVRPGHPLHRHGNIVDADRHQLQPDSVQHQGRIGRAGACHGQPGPDPRGPGLEGDVHLDGVDAERKGLIVGQLDGGDGLGAHGLTVALRPR